MNFNRNLVSATIDQLYQYTKQQNITLFPTEEYDFWAGYEANYAKFDRYFFQKFRAFKICQEYAGGTDIADILADWKILIDSFLFLNAKRYSELYRIQVLAATAYDIVNNYDVTEEYDRSNTGTVSDSLGARSDSVTHGQVQVTHENAQVQTSKSYGAVSESDTIGGHTDSNSSTLGSQTSCSTGSRSAFNSGLEQVEGSGITNGARSDSSSVTYGSHTDTHSENARSDSETVGAHTDKDTTAGYTDQMATGAQINQRTDNLREQSSLHRYGNIGVQTPANVIGGHETLWRAFKFYQMIFDEIAEEYLVIDVDFDFEASSYSGGGSGGDAELLAAIRAVSAQVTALAAQNVNETTTVRGDISGAKTAIREDIADGITVVNSNVNAATGVIINAVTTFGAANLGATRDVKQAVVTYSAAIRGDIGQVTTQGY